MRIPMRRCFGYLAMLALASCETADQGTPVARVPASSLHHADRVILSPPPGALQSGLANEAIVITEAPRATGIAAPSPAGKPTPRPAPAPRDMYFRSYPENPTVATRDDAQSTFAIDVDTGSFTLVKNYLDRGILPPPEAVRVEEMINYLPDRYAPPERDDFAVYSEMVPSPFSEGAYLLRIGVKGREVPREERKPLRLTLVIDTSGSMADGNRLGLVKDAVRDLIARLEPGDRIGISAFSSRGYEVLGSTDLRDSAAIVAAVDRLYPHESTNAEQGLEIGYRIARDHYDSECVNRVVLFSDGVANTGITSPEGILEEIRASARKRIYLTTVGVGMGNYNDALLEQIANQGNGHYLYMNDREQARAGIRKLLRAAEVIAQDVKIQVEFDPQTVESYRLFGFENRKVADRDFLNDRVDAGEVGSGHSATALYELRLRDVSSAGRIGTVSIRYKQSEKNLRVREIRGEMFAHSVLKPLESADPHFALTITAAGFAETLRNSYWARDLNMRLVARLAEDLGVARALSPEAGELREIIDAADRLLVIAERPFPSAPEGERVSNVEFDSANRLSMRGVRP